MGIGWRVGLGAWLTAGFLAGSTAFAAGPHPRRTDSGGAPDAGPRGERDGRRSGPDGVGPGRRAIEGGGSSVLTSEQLTKTEEMMHMEWRAGGCAIDGESVFVRDLLATQNDTDLMSLELWGDSHEYVPFQKVFYYMRVPRAAYVTLFWIGPRHDVFVPFQNVKVPADRDISIDSDSIIVPPLGREQWVAIATLQPVLIDCDVGQAAHLAYLARVKAIPHGVGRWEVRSKPGGR